MGDKAEKYIYRELFNLSTTMQADYKKYDTIPKVKVEYMIKTKKPVARPAPYLLKDTATMFERKVQIPFDLYWKTEGIIRDDPRVPQEPYAPFADREREEIQKTRPRVILDPAAIIDDIEEPERQRFISDMYTTTYMKLMREPVARAAKNLKVTAPLPAMAASSTVVGLKKKGKPYISPEWRGLASSSVQASLDTTSIFWRARPATKCSACNFTAKRETLNRKQR